MCIDKTNSKSLIASRFRARLARMPDLRRTALLLGLATVLISLSAVGLRVVPSSRRRQFPSDSLPPSQSELNEEEGGPLPFPTDRRPVRAASLPLPDPSVLFSAHHRPSVSQRGAAAASSSSPPPPPPRARHGAM